MYSVQQIKQLIAEGNKIKFYKDNYWKTLREKILSRDNYECQECKKEGKLTIKQHGRKLDIHHIKELEEHPELAYTESNLETVCVYHHNILDEKHINGTTRKKYINEEKW